MTNNDATRHIASENKGTLEIDARYNRTKLMTDNAWAIDDKAWSIENRTGVVDVRVKDYHFWPSLLPMLNASPVPTRIVKSDYNPCVFDVTSARRMSFDMDDVELPEDLHSKVSSLTLRQCRIANVDRICNLVHLTKLNMSWCDNLTVPPQDLWRLTSLERLNLSMNNIVAIPDSYTKFTSLKHVKLICNLLEEVPTQFWNCNAPTLDLAGNPCYKAQANMQEKASPKRQKQKE